MEEKNTGKIVVESLRKQESRKTLLLVVNESGEIINYLDNGDLANIIGLDISEKNFEKALNELKYLDKNNKRLLLERFKKIDQENNEYDADFLIQNSDANNNLLHFHFAFYTIDGKKILMVRDETEITRLKRSLETEKIRLEQQREHFMNDLLNLAHEVRGPLATAGAYVKNLLEILEEKEIIPTQELSRKLKIIFDSLFKTERMLHEILESEKVAHQIGGLLKEKIDMYEDIVKSVLQSPDISEAITKKRIIMDHRSSMKKGAAIIYVDVIKTKILWKNLLENALKYMPEEGRLSYGSSYKNGYFEFNVYNEGTPIPDELTEKIFEKGVRGNEEESDNSKNGFGLGLFFAKKIVELHDGEIWAEKGRKEGVNIIFRLPEK